MLAGGGVTGIAWETGVLLGLAETGFDCVAAADVIIGTSAGSTVGAQVTSGVPLRELWERQVADEHREITPELDLALMARILGELGAGGTTDDATRRLIGELALGADTVSPDERRAVIEWRLPSHTWPGKRLMVTAVDAATGAFTVWDAASGVPLVDAVAASCAVPGVWPCVPVNGALHYDGGLRTSTNAHLAAGHERVVIIAPLTQGVTPLIAAEVEELRANGATVSFIITDDAAREAMGPNALDPRFRRAAAEHGLRQGSSASVVL